MPGRYCGCAIDHLGSNHDAQARARHSRQSPASCWAAGMMNSTSAWTPMSSPRPGPHRCRSRPADDTAVGRAVLKLRPPGFDTAIDHDEVFARLVLARIIEPTARADNMRGILPEPRSGLPADHKHHKQMHLDPAPNQLARNRVSLRS